MGTVGEIGATSFDAYEGIRIVIPGAVAVGVAGAVERTLHAGPAVIGGDTGLTILLALAVGLVLYYLDLPSRSAGYLQRDQPSQELTRRYGRSHARPDGLRPLDVLNRYFLLFDTEMPTTIRNRSLYMGSMYRIAFEALVASTLASSIVMTAAISLPADTTTPRYWRTGCIIALVAHAAALVLAWVVAVNAARKRAERQGPDATVPSPAVPFVRALRVRHMAIYLVGLALLTVGSVDVAVGPIRVSIGETWRVAGAALTVGYSLLRYTAGDPVGIRAPARRPRLRDLLLTYLTGGPRVAAVPRQSRESMNPLAAALLFTAPVMVMWARLLDAHALGVARPAALFGWLTVQLAVFALIASRGHERKQRGAYIAQNGWIDLNPTTCELFFAPNGGPEVLATHRQAVSAPSSGDAAASAAQGPDTPRRKPRKRPEYGPRGPKAT